MKLVFSRSMFKIAMVGKWSSVRRFQRYVLILQSAEKDSSAEHEVAGMEARILAADL